MDVKTERGGVPPNVWFVFAVGNGLIFFLLWMACVTANTTTNRLLWILGVACGFLLGVLISPFPGEEGRFKNAGAALSAVLSGFLVSKLDRIFEHSMEYGKKPSPDLVAATLIFMSTTLVVLAVSAVARAYGLKPSSKKPNGEAAPPAPGSQAP